MRALLLLFTALLPPVVKPSLYRWLFGWKIAPSARIGLSYVSAESVAIGAHARIGHFTIIKSLQTLEVGPAAIIGHFNRISGAYQKPVFPHAQARLPQFIIKEHAALTHGHLVDCSDSVTIGALTTVAGYGTQFWTHEINVLRGEQSTRPIVIGRHCLVGSRALFLPGSMVGDRSVVAAGSVVRGQLEGGWLHAGVPAIAKKRFTQSEAYFVRDNGAVD